MVTTVLSISYRKLVKIPALSVLCLRCPVYSILYVLSCLFHFSCSLLAFLSWLSCLDDHFVLFPDNSFPTILLALSCFPCPACYARFPVLLLPFLSIMFCPASFILVLLYLLSCLRYLYGVLSIPGFHETAILSCLPRPSLHSFLSSPVFFQILSFCTG